MANVTLEMPYVQYSVVMCHSTLGSQFTEIPIFVDFNQHNSHGKSSISWDAIITLGGFISTPIIFNIFYTGGIILTPIMCSIFYTGGIISTPITCNISYTGGISPI